MEPAYIYEPHYNTMCFRVAAKDCHPGQTNFIIVCNKNCDYYGVWKWEYKVDTELKPWLNGKRLCYQIPIDACIHTQTKLVKPSTIEKAEKVCENVLKYKQLF